MPRPLTNDHRYALDTFHLTAADAPEIETIDLQAGMDVIKAGLVMITGPVIGTQRFALTDDGVRAREHGVFP